MQDAAAVEWLMKIQTRSQFKVLVSKPVLKSQLVSFPDGALVKIFGMGTIRNSIYMHLCALSHHEKKWNEHKIPLNKENMHLVPSSVAGGGGEAPKKIK